MKSADEQRRRSSASPEFERMNANGFASIHGDDLRLAAMCESIAARSEERPHLVEDHEAHAPGSRCARCDRTVAADAAARRRADGAWVHQWCIGQGDPEPGAVA